MILCLGLFALTLTAFWPVRNSAFINFDDLDYVVQNTQVQQGLRWSTVKWAFTTFHAGNWHPLTWLSHALDCQFFGVNARAHHLVSLFLHCANTIVLFLLLQELTGARWRSLVVAALFGVHPVHVESVAWVSERKDVLSTLFLLLTVWAYARYVEAGRPEIEDRKADRSHLSFIIFYLLSLLLFGGSLMSKPMGVTLPFLLLLLDFWPLRRMLQNRPIPAATLVKIPGDRAQAQSSLHAARWRAVLVDKIPFLALSAGSGMLTMLAQRQSEFVTSTRTVPLDLRLLNAIVASGGYLKKFFWPADLAVYYPYHSLHPSEGVVPAIVLIAVTMCAIVFWKKEPWLAVGWFWFLGTLVPVIGLVQVGLQSMADRYMYIPSIGLLLALVWTLADAVDARTKDSQLLTGRPALRRVGRYVLAMATIIALAGCFVRTSAQAHLWKDNETLYHHALRVTGPNPMIEANLGGALIEQGRFEEAIPWLAKAPYFAEAQLNWGVAAQGLGRLEEAAEHYRRAVELRPGMARAHYLLGNTLNAQGRRTDAKAELEAALRLDPESPFAMNDLAWILAAAPEPALRDGPRAVELARRACWLTEFKEPLFIGTLAASYAEAGRFEDAVETARKAAAVAEAAGDKKLASRNRELCELYKKGAVYHESAP